MKSMKLGLLFSTAALAFATGCGDITGGADGGSEGAPCTSDDNCATGLACHPGLSECRYTCTGDSECPTSEKHCAPFSSGADAGVAAQFCGCTPLTDNSLCAAASASTPFCNYQTHTCAAAQGTAPGPLACTGTLTSKQPEVCGYGSWCSDADQHCAELAEGTCSNISSSTHAWTAGQSAKGPVFFKFIDDTEAGADPCPTPTDTRYIYYLHAYAGTDLGEWPATRGGLPHSTYFLTSGAPSVTINFHLEDMTHGYDRCGDTGVTCDAADKSIAKFHPTVCTSSAAGFQGAYAFDNGNGFCFNAVHN